MNFPSVFGLYDVLILVKMSFMGNSIYGGFFFYCFVGFKFFLTASSVISA